MLDTAPDAGTFVCLATRHGAGGGGWRGRRLVAGWFSVAGAFLLGRKTYQIFAAFWPHVTDQNDPVAAKLNSLPKYVASTTLDSVEWNNSTLINGDAVEAVARLKQQPAGELQVHGSGDLAQTLMRHRCFVDEYRLWIYPVVLGSGKRLFGAGSSPAALKLAEIKTTSTGVVIHVYSRRESPRTARLPLRSHIVNEINGRGRRLPGELGESMSRLRRIAEIPAGSWTKWLVVGLWLVVVVVAFPLSNKLMGAEKNDASGCPPTRSRTQVLDLQSRFQSPNIFPAVVVYDRASGLTAADRAKAAADARSFAGLGGVEHGQVTGPIGSADGKAIQTIVSVNLGSQGWNGAATAADSIRAITLSDAGRPDLSHHRPAGERGRQQQGVQGHRQHAALYATLAVVIVILLITYRSPVLWLLPVLSAGVALITAEAVVYLLAAHAGLTVNARSAGILLVLVFGASTDYALLIVARYREELRRHDRRHAGDGRGAAPRGPGDHRQRQPPSSSRC